MLDTSIDFTYFSFVMDVDNAMRRINFFREELQANEKNPYQQHCFKWFTRHVLQW